MIFNTYNVESEREIEESKQRQSKRAREDVADKHKLLVAPRYTKYYEGKPTYKWNLTASQP